MENNNLKNVKRYVLLGLMLLFALSAVSSEIYGQQSAGNPVSKDKLIRQLRSKQFQTKDFVNILSENGVDFLLTPSVERELVAAGARPGVIEAVRKNYRRVSNNANVRRNGKKVAGSPRPPTYNDLIEQAVYSYDNRKDTQGSSNILQRAIRLESRNPRAYQVLGFINLYGFINYAAAERNWRMAIALGGNAVFRVFHDHTGKFTDTCRGSLYISRSIIVFESDNNVHTFNTSIANVDEIKIDNSSTPLSREKHSTYKIILRAGNDHAKFRFAPLTGNKEESKMVERLIRWKY